MYCNSCGAEIPAEARFCSRCGAAVASEGGAPAGVAPGNARILERPLKGRKIAGVCLGMANYFGIDATLMRILWLLATILWGAGLVAYIVAWILIPEAPATPLPSSPVGPVQP